MLFKADLSEARLANLTAVLQTDIQPLNLIGLISTKYCAVTRLANKTSKPTFTSLIEVIEDEKMMN